MYKEAPIRGGNFDYVEFTRILKHGKKDRDDDQTSHQAPHVGPIHDINLSPGDYIQSFSTLTIIIIRFYSSTCRDCALVTCLRNVEFSHVNLCTFHRGVALIDPRGNFRSKLDVQYFCICLEGYCILGLTFQYFVHVLGWR